METPTTRVFNNGSSQAVRISRNEAGDLVIHPLRVPSGGALLQALKELGEVDDAFVAALEADQQDSLPMQEREAL